MTEFLFFIAHYYPIARENLRQFVTNLRTAQNWKCGKTPAFATLYAFFPVRTKNLKNLTSANCPKPQCFQGFQSLIQFRVKLPLPLVRECPCLRTHLLRYESDPRSPFYQSTNPEVTHEQS